MRNERSALNHFELKQQHKRRGAPRIFEEAKQKAFRKL